MERQWPGGTSNDDFGGTLDELYSDAATDDGDEDPMRSVSVLGERTPDRDLSEAFSEEFDQTALPSSTEFSTVVGESVTSSHDKKYPASSSRLVKFTVTLTLAIPEGLEGGGKKLIKKSISMRSLEASKPLKYFHIEWTLLPNGEVTKLDIVTFATAAKVYMGIDSQVLKPWYDGDQMWLVFSHSVELPVSKETLLKLGSYVMTLHIWDSKDKVSSKAKFDRSKPLRIFMENKNMDEEKHLVQEQLKLLKNSPLLTTYKETNHIYPEDISQILGEGPVTSSDEAKIEHLEPASRVQPQQSEKEPCADFRQGKVKKKKISASQTPTKGTSHKKRTGGVTAAEPKTKPKSKTLHEEVPQQRSQKKKVTEKYRSGTIKLDMRLLLAGEKSVTNKMDDRMPGIRDAIFTISVDNSLMSEEMERELNPMVIRIISASSMPSTPVPIHVLQEKCGPVYCQYRFYDMPRHQTKARGHGTEISFKDVNVILTGTFNPDKLKEYLLGPPLEIEIHDRDRKLEFQPVPPALFGTEVEDTKLSNVGLASSKRTIHDPFTTANKCWDPYGIAKVTFSDLIYGEKCLNVAVSIQNSSIPDPTGYKTDGLDERIIGVSGAVDVSDECPLPKGHYLESNSVLNVRIELAYPLMGNTDVPLETEECQFGRVIYIFDYKNTKFLNVLLETINSVNSAAICPDFFSNDGSEAADIAFKMESELKESSKQDILTGFHVMDGKIHLFVLEGLRNEGLRKLWRNLPVRSVAPEEERIKVLYNSNFSFHQRLYACMDDNVYHIHLREPLHDIVKQPLLYIRDMTPQDCFQALCRLQYMCCAKKLRQVVQGDLFPPAEMVKLLSREFGIPASKTGPLTTKTVPSIKIEPVYKLKPTKRESYSLVDIYDEKYLQKKSNQIFPDHVQGNIDAVSQAGKMLKKTKRRTITAIYPEGKAVHIYSSQALNSAQQAKELLHQEIAKKPNSYFTYNQDFLSASVAPVDSETEKKKAKERSKLAWLTLEGFRFHGFKSSLESNEHPKKPDQARISDLKKAWKEHILYGNLFKPILPRGRWKWSERHKDFELYKKLTYEPTPVSIHLAGDTLKAEQLETIYKDYEDWRSKLLVNKNKCCNLKNAELQTTGPEANTQVHKSVIASLKQPISILQRTAYADVGNLIRCKSPHQSEITKGFAPGLNDNRSWKINANIIPRYDMEHKKFADLKGNDFNVYCNKHTLIYNPKFNPLNEEMKTHLFQTNKPATEVL
ncbi:uncharacterized protein cfap92 isoform X2 [Stegostoma tigrinum]|uniref:uncharacterized protein cfap92 isoform X2 n=1 Tax=Stegostoma tigrinum TaxID=3053191 RepID=UPI00202ADBAC|nr:uncharacterized protein cfap92 isoform X2 [Stegostoma tigrinum]